MLTPSIFKANDIRGVVGGPKSEWDADGAYAIGAAFVAVLELEGKAFVMGRDMRTSGPELSQAFARGATARGADVIDIGLASTDELYFASGHLAVPGVMFTASHNPASYNGIKFCRALAQPLDPTQLVAIAALAGEEHELAETPGTISTRDLLPAYAAHLHSLVNLAGIRPLKVVVDAGNGMAGHTTAAVLGTIPHLHIRGLFMDLDGTFPNHQPNPLEPQNLVDAERAVRAQGADLALVFDGDADRCFIIDEHGHVVSPSIITALVAVDELKREHGGTIVINTITSRIVGEVVKEVGGKLAISRVGHTYVKALMASEQAIFGGEHSAHYYFRDFWGADTGMLAALHVIAILGRSTHPLSELVRRYERYVPSGEINTSVLHTKAAMERVDEGFVGRGRHTWDDGLLIEGEDWWVSVRPSNTEPLLRLNVEARDRGTMSELRDLALALIRQENR